MKLSVGLCSKPDFDKGEVIAIDPRPGNEEVPPETL
jgi:hypothetical protein